MTKSKTIWQTTNGWRLETVDLQRPDGQLEQKGIVRHPGAVVLVPLTAAGEVLMLHQYRLALDREIIEVPAGTRGWEEDWLLCAQRELREESGHRADHFIELGDLWPAPGVSDELMKLFLATELTPDPLPQDFDEDISVRPYPLPELVTMALDGRLQDAKSVAAILRAHHHLEASNNQ
ncbi:MAG: NUDIX hydrolase [Ardenticatenaceae bacterium]|nr:NUDIX hydrolase [Ardenticatenaceae bacterium]